MPTPHTVADMRAAAERMQIAARRHARAGYRPGADDPLVRAARAARFTDLHVGVTVARRVASLISSLPHAKPAALFDIALSIYAHALSTLPGQPRPIYYPLARQVVAVLIEQLWNLPEGETS
ncbi:hypothetical protein [Amycolatopsis thermophila]|uniref:Uncharacterized protein n=1 Tax=Amycolatopsis thermophila TaxID=206084 RepID=A0ABU0EP95_9PSEU|nr:hypothetical protein [Amycolatopsis thermophila]MDQ0376627.1 hypothetical protein [Amycolatopsis thermophila]